MNNDFQSLGKYLKNRRLAVGLTQAELSQTLKVHVQFVSNWERGLCAPPVHCFQRTLDILQTDRQKIVKLMVQDSKRIIEEKIYRKTKEKSGFGIALRKTKKYKPQKSAIDTKCSSQRKSPYTSERKRKII